MDDNKDIEEMVDKFATVVESNAENAVVGSERGSNAWAQRWTEAVSVLKGTGFEEGKELEEANPSKS